MNTNTCEHEEFSAAVIEEEMTAAEFKVATFQAIEMNESEFIFCGHEFEVTYALDAISNHEYGRTYH